MKFGNNDKDVAPAIKSQQEKENFWFNLLMWIGVLLCIGFIIFMVSRDINDGYHTENLCLLRDDNINTTCSWNSSLNNCYNPGTCQAYTPIEVMDGCQITKLDKIDCNNEAE